MSTTEGHERLTEREKQTLRLILRGHDAKSIARHLGLSVHTINERLRNARQKMAVSSSREAARLLLDQEGYDPNSIVPERIGEAVAESQVQQSVEPAAGGRRALRFAGIAFGVVIMTFALGLLILASQPPLAIAPTQSSAAVDASSVTGDDTTKAVEASARQWLALVDQGRWDDSWKATGTAFRKLNSPEVWARASNRVRVPLGAMITRTLISHENLPAPPHGFEVVKFRTSFANQANAVETVTLDREGGGWRVVGITVG